MLFQLVLMLAVRFWKLVETSMLVVTNNAKTSDSTISDNLSKPGAG